MNMQNLMKQAQAMQKEITNSQKKINEMEFIGKNGLVTVKLMRIINTQENVGELISLNTAVWNKVFKAEILKKFDEIENPPRILEDMILLALNDAFAQIDKVTEEKMGKYASMFPGMM